jgi:tRNA (mo5U34)-methyltransferase
MITAEEGLRAEIDRLGASVPWYHRFELPCGVVIPGWEGIYGVWDNIRSVRNGIDYVGKRVLDLGCRDGMWAFDAEKRGASTVIATDIGCEGYREHAAFIKAVTSSRVGIYFNVPAEDAFSRLDTFFAVNPGKFDIVQHLGLLYHLEDPIRSLREARKCLKTGGTLLLETAYWRDGGEKPAALFNSRSDVYSDLTTHWAFNLAALQDAMKLCRFGPWNGNMSTIDQGNGIGRVALWAKAV